MSRAWLVYRLTGYLSVLVGICAVLCISRVAWMRIGMGLAIAGMLLSVVNIFLHTRHFQDRENIPKGYFGLFFSSLPVIFMILLIRKFS